MGQDEHTESHRSGEGPGCIAVGQGRAHGLYSSGSGTSTWRVTVLARAQAVQQWVRDEHMESHRSGEGPGCIAVGQGRAHGESPFW